MFRTKTIRRSAGSRSARTTAGILALVLAAGGLPLRSASAQSEDQVKAAFLFNFARYVEWPESAFRAPDAPLRICTLGGNGFSKVVSDVVSGKQVGDRAVEVTGVANVQAATDCHILFVERADQVQAGAVITTLGEASVFTVSDDEGFAEAGGVANFFRADNKVRFEINPEAAQRAGLKISSRLLRLARVVE